MLKNSHGLINKAWCWSCIVQPGEWNKGRFHILRCISESTAPSAVNVTSVNWITSKTIQGWIFDNFSGLQMGSLRLRLFPPSGVISPVRTLEENNHAWGSLPSTQATSFLPYYLNHWRAPLGRLPLPLPPLPIPGSWTQPYQIYLESVFPCCSIMILIAGWLTLYLFMELNAGQMIS